MSQNENVKVLNPLHLDTCWDKTKAVKLVNIVGRTLRVENHPKWPAASEQLQSGDPWIAKLVYMSPITGVYGTGIHGGCRPTCNLGAAPCSPWFASNHWYLAWSKCWKSRLYWDFELQKKIASVLTNHKTWTWLRWVRRKCSALACSCGSWAFSFIGANWNLFIGIHKQGWPWLVLC